MCLGETCRVIDLLPGDMAETLTSRGEVVISLLALDEPVTVGDWVLVHSGFALAVLSEEDVYEASVIRETEWRDPT